MNSIVKVQWKNSSDGWKAKLLLAGPNGFEKRGLQPGRKVSFEVTNERRCTGFAPSPGERAPCPEFREIDSGSQCSECRGKDIYSDYVRGDTQTDLDGEFSVYLAQIGQEVKVGVTRSEKIPKRWVEQGADYGAEILSGLSSKVALENEQDISSRGITERIRKEQKTNNPSDPRKLQKIMEEHDYDAEIVDVNSLTLYDRLQGEFSRKGLFQGEIHSVKGQIIGNGRLALAMTSGKVLKNPDQKGLNSF
ncbi:DUF2797 domain-containing protein [Candidatus Nanohalovita haloferacivicina]|uniref:DUF2797 domain-containing protein n=1 Tax=Candidatus Nanohalovita haloferacivicina TaxID=2978046 RepID=UPI00325FB102